MRDISRINHMYHEMAPAFTASVCMHTYIHEFHHAHDLIIASISPADLSQERGND
jgi:hypothetical protein